MKHKNLLSPARERRVPAARRLAGFTLIELMVAMVIGLFLVLAMTTLLINVGSNNKELSKTNGLIENGRFALQLLEDDLSHAGFLGGYVPEFDNLTVPDEDADEPYIPAGTSYPGPVMPDPCRPFNFPPHPAPGWPGDMRTSLIGIPVQGYEIPDPVPSPVLPVCADKVTNPKANTDVLFVRHLDREEKCLRDLAGKFEGAASEIADCREPRPEDQAVYFQQSRCGDSIIPQPGDPAAYVLQGYLPDPGNPGQGPALFPLQQRDCQTLSRLRKFVSNLYYVRDYAVRAGDGIPTLMRSQFGPVAGPMGPALSFQPAQPMIEGVEAFRVEYGVDSRSDTGAAVDFTKAIKWANPDKKISPVNRGDGIPDGDYVRCTVATPCTVDQMANTVAVRIYVLVRSLDWTPGYEDKKTYNLGGVIFQPPAGDRYKRHLFVRTIRLQNVSSRRETP